MAMTTAGATLGTGIPGNVTQLLAAWGDGDPAALDKLMPHVYGELRRLARSRLRFERKNHTLQTTGLVHEAYLRVLRQANPKFESRGHFYAIAARLMRQILVEHARRRNAGRRKHDRLNVSLDDSIVSPDSSMDLVELDQLLTTLVKRSEQQSRIVELRYFAGLSIEETAAALQTSSGTVKRQWRVARAWLYREMRKQ